MDHADDVSVQETVAAAMHLLAPAYSADTGTALGAKQGVLNNPNEASNSGTGTLPSLPACRQDHTAGSDADVM